MKIPLFLVRTENLNTPVLCSSCSSYEKHTLMTSWIMIFDLSIESRPFLMNIWEYLGLLLKRLNLEWWISLEVQKLKGGEGSSDHFCINYILLIYNLDVSSIIIRENFLVKTETLESYYVIELLRLEWWFIYWQEN